MALSALTPLCRQSQLTATTHRQGSDYLNVSPPFLMKTKPRAVLGTREVNAITGVAAAATVTDTSALLLKNTCTFDGVSTCVL